MKITVTQTSTDLETLATPDIQQVYANANVLDYIVTIQNLWATDIYVENWLEATIATGTKIIKWVSTDVRVNDAWIFNMISEWADNTDVRIIIT